jgi:hypothetical protein
MVAKDMTIRSRLGSDNTAILIGIKKNNVDDLLLDEYDFPIIFISYTFNLIYGIH